MDASKRRLPLQKKIGAGLSVEEFRARVKEGTIKHVGLPESVAMVADSLGLAVDEITETIEPKVATEKVTTEFLTVEAGQAAGAAQDRIPAPEPLPAVRTAEAPTPGVPDVPDISRPRDRAAARADPVTA